MRIAFSILVAVSLVGCFASYSLGYRHGLRQSPLREERQGQVLYAIGMYRAAEATNWAKVQSFIDTQVVAFTRDYARRFGVPGGTNIFSKRFRDAMTIADRVEKKMVPVQASSE